MARPAELDPVVENADIVRAADDWHQFCENIDGHIGVIIDGAFAEYLVVDCRNSCHVPDGLSMKSAAPLACAGVYHLAGYHC